LKEVPVKGLPALYIKLDALRDDPALQPGRRGARKLLVTELYGAKEEEASDAVWSPPRGAAKCPVQVMPDTELAVFTHLASQDRHWHEQGTEIYMVIEGEMIIEVEGVDYPLSAGDMIVVNPGAKHQVRPQGTEFLCRVVTVNCGGAADKKTDQVGPIARRAI
jgi:mannose-6-phosphate isomerase-like protein (cupin superfamily)